MFTEKSLLNCGYYVQFNDSWKAFTCNRLENSNVYVCS